MIAVVERHVDTTLRGRIEESFSPRIFTNRTGRSAVVQTSVDFRPRCAAVVGPPEMRTHIVETERVDCRVCGLRVETARIHVEHFHPWLEPRGRYVLPGHAPVCCGLDDAVVGADPEAIDVHVRRRDRVDDA